MGRGEGQRESEGGRVRERLQERRKEREQGVWGGGKGSEGM